MVAVEYTVPGASVNECPVSYVTPESYELVQLYARSKQIGGEAGTVTLFGPDLREWPARIADAFCSLETERVKTDSARLEAEIGETHAPDGE